MPDSNNPCTTCRIIRYFLVALVPIVILYLSGTELPALRGIMLTQIAGWVFGTGFVLLIGWKVWNEYWRN
jgi:preprotein translocase subunit SecF